METMTRVSFIPHGLWGLLARKSANSLMVPLALCLKIHQSLAGGTGFILPLLCRVIAKSRRNARLSGRIVDRIAINTLLNSRAGMRAPGALFRNRD